METIAGYALSPTALWLLLAVVFGAWIVASWMLAYHWRTYARGSRGIRRVIIVYFSISFLIFIAASLLIVSV